METRPPASLVSPGSSRPLLSLLPLPLTPPQFPPPHHHPHAPILTDPFPFPSYPSSLPTPLLKPLHQFVIRCIPRKRLTQSSGMTPRLDRHFLADLGRETAGPAQARVVLDDVRDGVGVHEGGVVAHVVCREN